MVTPFDKSALRNIEQAIRDSDLGVNPSNDGSIIRVTFPELTEERRRDSHQGRQDQGGGQQGLHPLGPSQGQGRHRQGDQGRRHRRGRGPSRREELDDTTAKYVAQVDELLKHKEAELLEV